jgi:hypothetical protein
MRRLLAWYRRRRHARFAAAYPTSAWVSQFKTPEELAAALDRGEHP